MSIALETRTMLTEGIARAEWGFLSKEARLQLLMHLAEQSLVPRPLNVFVGGSEVDNKRASQLASEAVHLSVDEWDYETLVVLSMLWLWKLSSTPVYELNQCDLSFSVIRDFYEAKYQAYLALKHADDDVPEPGASTFDLAKTLPVIRDLLQRNLVRCMRINGATWERREWFLPREDVKPDDIPATLSSYIYARTGQELPDCVTHEDTFRQLTEAVIDAGVNPAEILVALAHFALDVPELGADYSIITCATGSKLDTPDQIVMTDVLSYAAVRESFDPAEHGVRLNIEQIRNAVSQRQRYNVVCRVRNYSPDPEVRKQAQAFQMPDIAVMEDAHHNGHRANGVRFTTRAPIEFEIEGVDGARRLLRGLADFRINRSEHHPSRQFTAKELAFVIRVSWWMKIVAETTWKHGLQFDGKYCVKQDSYTDADGGELKA